MTILEMFLYILKIWENIAYETCVATMYIYHLSLHYPYQRKTYRKDSIVALKLHVNCITLQFYI